MDERLALGGGWLDSFKKRCGLKEFKRHGEAASANLDDVTADRNRIQKFLAKEKYALGDIFNMDETGLFWAVSSVLLFTNKFTEGHFQNGARPWSNESKACRCQGKEGLPNLRLHHKCRWLREAPTFHHWEGKKNPALSRRKPANNSAFTIGTTQQPG